MRYVLVLVGLLATSGCWIFTHDPNRPAVTQTTAGEVADAGPDAAR